ncbi:hypothetical protein ACIQ9E_25725 [Streptomyces sp. NPDC094448]|uniref:hypothetical protein n=1 Tax=Streptomyces sp. NPDC094448 TaxID=3366063 RepID=UPI003812247F
MNGTPGATRSTIDRLRTLGVYAAKPDTVLEIGPGSGRCPEKTLKECSPERYEIYETAAPWADCLVGTSGVIARPTEGAGLAPTSDGSFDLVQAHKVFNTVTFLCAALGCTLEAGFLAPMGVASPEVPVFVRKK